MALLKEVLVPKARTSNFDKSFRNRFDFMPGVAIPCFCQEVVPNQTTRVRTQGRLSTFPLKGPLMGSFKWDIAFFWVPTRLYTQQLDQNQLITSPQYIRFPTFRIPYHTIDEEQAGRDTPYSTKSGVVPNSLLDYFGFAPHSFEVPPLSTSGTQYVDITRFNATPIIGYYDIMRNYYVNTQDADCFLIGDDGSTHTWGLIRKSPTQLDSFINWFVTHPGDTSLDYSTSGTDGAKAYLNPVRWSCNGDVTGQFDDRQRCGGLFVVNHRPDLFTTYISNSRYNEYQQLGKITTAGDSFTMDQLRMASHITDYYQTGLFGGGRYDDWVEAQFGVRTSRTLCIPQLLGVLSSDLVFDEVVSTSNSESQTEMETAQGLGGLGAKGRGMLTGRPINFHATEHGYLIGIMTLTPNVSYGQGIKPEFWKTRYTDLYSPQMDRIGFQGLPTGWMYTLPKQQKGADGKYRLLLSDWSFSIGKIAAWQEYITAVDEVHGSFIPGGPLDYLAITRDFMSGTNGILGKEDYTLYMNTSVFPTQFNYPFKNTDPLALNFWCQLGFDVFAKIPKSKNVMPNLSMY